MELPGEIEFSYPIFDDIVEQERAAKAELERLQDIERRKIKQPAVDEDSLTDEQLCLLNFRQVYCHEIAKNQWKIDQEKQGLADPSIIAGLEARVRRDLQRLKELDQPIEEDDYE